MKHLTVDEIIEFVSSDEYSEEGIKLVKSVNEHIRKCSKCLKLVRVFQLIYDEFDSLCSRVDFKTYVYNIANMKKRNYLRKRKKLTIL